MENINNITELNYQDALDASYKYYKTLSKLGYINTINSTSVLVYTFIIDFYRNYYSLLKADDKKTIFDIINCINSKSCVFNK